MPEPWKSITGITELEERAAAAQAPQLTSALPTGNAEVKHCSICGSVLSGKAYLVESKLACANCATSAGVGPRADDHAAFAQGLLFGIGAALLGLAFYATFTIVTHIYIGYVALAVGWLVGKAIKTGSGGVGGLRYQISAVLLTYAAISLAEIPILMARAMEHGGGDVDWASMAPKLILWGIASPFLELQQGFFGIIGLVILFVGIRFAWRITAE